MIFGLILGLGACATWGLLLWWSERDAMTGPWPPQQGNWPTAAWSWGLTILIYVGLFQTWVVPTGPWAWLIWTIGLGIGFAGSALQTWGMANLRFFGTSGWDVGVSTHGAYAWSRHPQYVGQAAGFLGFAIILGHLPGWIIALSAIATLTAAAMVEEAALTARHPEYAAYRARVPFLLRRPT
ncbi:methyltransferase family protein [Gymnodinialimonas ulvae]|uniref:methyltransferase family protein n=1 Tax=Gymnodinialimonas ulvae TaxID=3126504 RepID=UPI0030A8BA5F